jgi:phosphatidylserine/phosphatidylglycerophosphate/cardiolipin synthase-like enzyme
MRFCSEKIGGYKVFAVTGTNTVSFAIDPTEADTKGLLGFGIERIDQVENERYFLYGFKVFESVIPNPTPDTVVSTRDHPVQSFVFDDFTAKPGRRYSYLFHPLKDRPKNLDRSATPVPITVETEPTFMASQTHEVFFNRGVASSQAYRRRFDNESPDKLEEPKRKEALDWLSRDLAKAFLSFVAEAKSGDTLLGCFYEFRYEPALKALKEAREMGVNVRLIVDAKENGKDEEAPFPRAENLKMLKKFGFKKGPNVIMREAKPNDIQHNKFMVLLRTDSQDPNAVWTGSTNLSVGGFHGQTNVGHWVRDNAVAARFKAYWDLLGEDPGPTGDEDRSAARKENDTLREAVDAIDDEPADWKNIASGVTPVFSPRPGLGMLELYADLFDGADDLSCITLAFGINKVFKSRILDNDQRDQLTFFLLEKDDKPKENAKEPFVRLSSRNNAYLAYGSYLRDTVYQWARETNAMGLGLNKHVSYIHSKFLLKDPLGADPVVVTGSANFSNASTTANDENMLLIRGDTRVADIYFTEFNRLFFHYYFRSMQERAKQRPTPAEGFSLFLDPTDGWLARYKPGSLRQKRVDALTKMANPRTIAAH